MSIFCTDSFTFFDSEHLQEAVNDSDITHKQVTSGKFEATLTRRSLPGIVIDTGSYNLKLIAEGSFSKNTVSLVIVHNMHDIGRVCGEELIRGDLMILAPGTDAEFTLPNGTFWTCINVPEKLMKEYGMRDIKSEIFRPDKKIFYAFMEQYTQLNDLLNKDEYTPEVLQDMIISLFLVTIEETSGRTEFTYKDSYLIALNIRDELLEHIDEELQMKRLCKITGKSVRTVERTFKKYFDLSPREYHSYHRLLLIQQMLLHGGCSSISEAALRYGYLHLGNFSKKYKKVFGELPSQTLKRKKTL